MTAIILSLLLRGLGWMPSDVMSSAQLSITASGNPSTNIRMKARSAHSGAPNAGKAIDAAWIAIHAATR